MIVSLAIATVIVASTIVVGAEPIDGIANAKDAPWICNAEDGYPWEAHERVSREDEENHEPLAPSESPSLAPPCSDSDSNARGSYTSLRAPCVIRFHSIDSPSNRSSPYWKGTSSECDPENAIGEFKEYVSSWPDECVGDFLRCYDLFLSQVDLCPSLSKVLERNHRKTCELEGIPFDSKAILEIPAGTTHLSVDCTFDKDVLLESYQHEVDLQHARIKDAVSAKKETTMFAVVSFLISALVIIYAISVMVVRPITLAVMEVASKRGGSDINNDDDHPPTSAEEEELILGEGDLFEDDYLESQIPLDFDAVPMVSATIVPIHAEVVVDGISYST